MLRASGIENDEGTLLRLIDRDGRAVAVHVKRARTKDRGRSLST